MSRYWVNPPLLQTARQAILLCECGARPELQPPLSPPGSDPMEYPGRLFSMLYCTCGIEMRGPDGDVNCEQLAERWNLRMQKIGQNNQEAVKT